MNRDDKKRNCFSCVHLDKLGLQFPCRNCFDYDKYEKKPEQKVLKID